MRDGWIKYLYEITINNKLQQKSTNSNNTHTHTAMAVVCFDLQQLDIICCVYSLLIVKSVAIAVIMWIGSVAKPFRAFANCMRGRGISFLRVQELIHKADEFNLSFIKNNTDLIAVEGLPDIPLLLVQPHHMMFRSSLTIMCL